MPLRDHFRPPLDQLSSWEGFHGQWPANIVQQLRKQLPEGFVAEPRVHLGTQVEIDVATYEKDSLTPRFDNDPSDGGVATAVWAPAEPTVDVETEIPDPDEYEVRIYDVKRERRLVAAIEIVSPANKDRAELRNTFIAKCAGLLQKGVAVSIVDLVTIRQFNLYAELLTFIGQRDSTLGDPPGHLYAASMRWISTAKAAQFQAWSHLLSVGNRLPILPLWLTEKLVLPLDLEFSYENACHDLWIS